MGGLDTNDTNENNICQPLPTLDEHSGMDYFNNGDKECGEDNTTGNVMNIFILIASQAMIGIGGAPLFTLGTTYIDNHVEKEKAPAYIGE